jgi:hypothetical protein
MGGGICFPQSGRSVARTPPEAIRCPSARLPATVMTAREMPSPLSDAGCTLRPTLRLSVSRCSVTPLGHPSTAQSDEIPPAGLEPAASGLRARRHAVRPRGRELRRQESNLRLTVNSRASCRSTTPERSGGSRTRTCEAASRLRASNALPCQLGHASEKKRKERESNPQGPEAHPFSRRGTAPMAVLPKSDSGRSRTCTSPGKSRELFRF